MGMKPSEKAFADLKALAAAAGATKSVLQHLGATQLDSQAPSPAGAAIPDPSPWLKASTSRRAAGIPRPRSPIGGGGGSTFGCPVAMEAMSRAEPRFVASIAARIDDWEAHMGALSRLSSSNFEMRGKETFDASLTRPQLREWAAGKPGPAQAPTARPPAPRA